MVAVCLREGLDGEGGGGRVAGLVLEPSGYELHDSGEQEGGARQGIDTLWHIPHYRNIGGFATVWVWV